MHKLNVQYALIILKTNVQNVNNIGCIYFIFSLNSSKHSRFFKLLPKMLVFNWDGTAA